MKPVRDSELGWTPYLWLVYLGGLIAYPAMARAGAIVWLMTIASILVFLPLYFIGFRSEGGRLLAIIATIAALGLLITPWNAGGGVFPIYAAAFAPSLGKLRKVVITIGILEAAWLAEAWLLSLHLMAWIWPALFIVVIGAVNIHFAERSRVNRKLALAQEQVERLARTAERERIARDLHDLLGHTLSLIVLKSELASRLASTDPDASLSEIRDVERISREALAEVRGAVRGYRAETISAATERAREILGAAAIEADIRIGEFARSPAIESVVAMVIREGVTNVVRHSGAKRCSIELERDRDHVRVLISDDGRGMTRSEGTGLAGMRERVEMSGGEVVIRQDDQTRLEIRLPVLAGGGA